MAMPRIELGLSKIKLSLAKIVERSNEGPEAKDFPTFLEAIVLSSQSANEYLNNLIAHYTPSEKLEENTTSKRLEKIDLNHAFYQISVDLNIIATNNQCTKLDKEIEEIQVQFAEIRHAFQLLQPTINLLESMKNANTIHRRDSAGTVVLATDNETTPILRPHLSSIYSIFTLPAPVGSVHDLLMPMPQSQLPNRV